MAKQSRREEEVELQKDEVAETLHQWLAWFEENRKQVLTTAVAVLVVLTLWLVLQNRREGVRSDVNLQINQVLTNLDRLPTLTDATARQEMTKTAQQTLDVLIDKHGDTVLGNEARLLRGNLFFEQDRFADAQKEVTAYLEKAKGDSAKARGEIALAYAFENESFITTNTQLQRTKLETARQHYVSAQKLVPTGSYLFTYARLGEARYHELVGDNANAIRLYKEIMEQRPAPTPPPTGTERSAANKTESDLDRVRQELDKNMQGFSFATAARLRLERLQAQSSGTTTATTTVVTQ